MFEISQGGSEEGAARLVCDQGSIEKSYEWSGCLEAFHNLFEQSGLGGNLNRQMRAEAPLAVEDEIEGRGVRQETFGRAGEPLAIEFGHGGAQFF